LGVLLLEKAAFPTLILSLFWASVDRENSPFDYRKITHLSLLAITISAILELLFEGFGRYLDFETRRFLFYASSGMWMIAFGMYLAFEWRFLFLTDTSRKPY
jgi:hypothetical protein